MFFHLFGRTHCGLNMCLAPVSSSKAPVKNVRGTHGETTLAEPEVLHELEPSQGSDRPQARLSNFFKSGRPLPEVPKKVQVLKPFSIVRFFWILIKPL